MKKSKIKEKVLEFVESMGSARFVDIQKFIVDLKKGEGSYEAGRQLDVVWLKPTKKYERGRASAGWPNVHRGYYSSAFSGPYPWFTYGEDYLEKGEDGRYRVVRGKFKPRPYHRWSFSGRYEPLHYRLGIASIYN